MKPLRLCRALAVAACLAFAMPAAGAEDRPAPASGAAEARTLLQQGRFADALLILRPLARNRTAPANTRFLAGLAAMGAAQQPGAGEAERNALLNEAIAAFRAMLVERPDLVRPRLELARSFFLKGEDTLARRHFEQVLAGRPPAAVAANIRRYLAEIRARRRWSANAGFALAPDSNIGAGSEQRIIYIYGLPFRRSEDGLPTSGVGVSAWAGGEYQHPLGARARLRAGADIWRREYKDGRFDRMAVAGHVGPRWLAGRSSEISLLASVRRQWLADETDHRDLGLRIEARRRLGLRVTAGAEASWHERRHDRQPLLDGPVADISVGASWAAAPMARIEAGLGWARERPELKRTRNTSLWAQLGVSVALPWGFTLGGGGALRQTSYQGNWLPFTERGQPRKDRTRSIRLSAHNRAVTLWGFSPQLSVVREHRDSNAQLHDYRRTFGELRFMRLF